MAHTVRFRLRVDAGLLNHLKANLSYSAYFKLLIQDALNDFDSVEAVCRYQYSPGGQLYGVSLDRSTRYKLKGVCEYRNISLGSFCKLAIESFINSL